MQEQPFTLNHEATTREGIIGMSIDESMKICVQDAMGDLPMAMFLIGVLENDVKTGILLEEFLSVLTGMDLSSASRVAEYMVRTVTDRKDRTKIMSALMMMSLDDDRIEKMEADLDKIFAQGGN